MEKERKTKNIVIGVLLVAVLCLSVAFAAFTQITLQVNGTANIVTPNWSVKFTNVSNVVKPSVTTADPTFTDNTISYTVSLEAGQTYSFDATIKNAGTYDAKLTAYTVDEIPSWLEPYVEYSVTGLTKNSTLTPNSEQTLSVSFKIKEITDDTTLKNFQDAIKANSSQVTLNITAGYTPA